LAGVVDASNIGLAEAAGRRRRRNRLWVKSLPPADR